MKQANTNVMYRGGWCQVNIRDTLSLADVSIENSGNVGVYVCGLTVYDDAHVGHARSMIVFDVLRRWLERSGANVTFVQNFTDVDDKILKRAASLKITASSLTEKYIERYNEDAKSLNILEPTHVPKATEHIPDIIEMIRTLIDKRAAYSTANGVYFNVPGCAQYGKLSGKKTAELLVGARILPDRSKRNPLDFALWKLEDGQEAWDSPWGRGRPGWHIECSAMAAKYFDTEIDIHGGGRDLIFPHHENEIAQSETCHEHNLARAWMHVGMVTVEGEKMSKSLGNSKTVRTAISEYGPNALRVFCLGARYAKPIDYSESAMSECLTRWQQAESCYYELRRQKIVQTEYKDDPLWSRFSKSLDDNCDTRGALDALFELAGNVNEAATGNGLTSEHGSLRGAFDVMLDVLGLRVRSVPEKDADTLDGLANTRESLRADSKYDEADKARDQMMVMGADVLDHGKRTVWVMRDILS